MKPITITETVSLLSILGAGVVGVSLAYEIGFSDGAGVSLTDLSLNAQDLVKSAGAWVPPLFCFAVLGFALEAGTTHIEGGRTEEELLASTRKPDLWRRIRNSPDYLFLVLGLILWLELLLDAPFIRPIKHLSYSLVWLSIVGFLMTRPSIHRRFSRRVVFAIWALVGVVLFVYGTGKHDALRARERKATDTVELVTGTNLSGRLVRRYNDFVLFAQAGEKGTAIIPSNQIRQIRQGAR